MELNTNDPQAAKDFYAAVFGWKYKDFPSSSGPYSMIFDGKTGIGGIQRKPMPEAPTMWLGYVTVASVAKTVAKAAENGANVIVPDQEIPDMGRFAIFEDPTGAPVAIWQSTRPPEPAQAAPKKKATKKKAAKKKAAKKKTAKKSAKKKSAKKKK
jgi:predicted enzyme related to lactoylglutathione lyase